jgi:hypothetical protein
MSPAPAPQILQGTVEEMEVKAEAKTSFFMKE